MPRPLPLWLRDDIQFPRLLAEIRAIGLDEHQYVQLNEAMDLTVAQIDALFERAEAEWTRLKALTHAPGLRPTTPRCRHCGALTIRGRCPVGKKDCGRP